MKFRLQTSFKSKPPRIFQRKAGGSYYIRQQIHLKDYLLSLRTPNKKEAEKRAYQIWFYQQNKPIQAILDVPLEPLSEALIQYQKTAYWENLEDSTRTHKLSNWTAFTDWCATRGLKHVTDITPDNAEIYLESRECANKTFNNILNDLKQVFSESCRLSRHDNPFDQIRYRSVKKGEKASKPFRAFSDSEIQKILNHIPTSRMRYRDEWLLACHIARFTGARYKDVAMMQWTNIHDGYIEYVPYKTANKTGKAVIVKTTDELHRILFKCKRTSFYILPNLAATYDEKHATEPFVGILDYLNIKGTTTHTAGFHSWRATVTTKASLAGVDMKKLGGVLGHTSEEQTSHYDKSAREIDLSFLAG